MPGPGPDLLGGNPVGPVVRVRDRGGKPPHWEGVGSIPPQGVPQADREETLAREGRRLGIPPARGNDGGGGTAGVGDLRLPPPKNGHTVYFDQAHYGPVSGGGAETGAKGVLAVVVTGRGGCGGGADGGLGGETDRGG